MEKGVVKVTQNFRFFAACKALHTHTLNTAAIAWQGCRAHNRRRCARYVLERAPQARMEIREMPSSDFLMRVIKMMLSRGYTSETRFSPMAVAGEPNNYGEDVSVGKVGGVFKKILRQGTGSKSPQKHHEVIAIVHLDHRIWSIVRACFAPFISHRSLSITLAPFLTEPRSTAAATAKTPSHSLLEPAASSKACCPPCILL